MPKELHKIQMIPMGKNNGVFAFNKMVAQNNDSYAEKVKLRTNMMGFINGDPKAIAAAQSSQKQMKSFIGMAEGNCICLPMHISKVRGQNSEDLEKARRQFD